jgi:hypothetical protein
MVLGITVRDRQALELWFFGACDGPDFERRLQENRTRPLRASVALVLVAAPDASAVAPSWNSPLTRRKRGVTRRPQSA